MSTACTHPVQLHGLCALCGADVEHAYGASAYAGAFGGPDDAAEEGGRVLLLHDASLGLRVAPAEARRIEADMQDALLRARKLSLILDLDQTVVHATVSRAAVDAALAAGRCAPGDVHRVLLPETPDTPYWVVLRPGVEAFLAAMAERFEMHVYTMGSRSYARAVSALLDPSAAHFYDRVLSREDVIGDGTEPVRKSLRRLFPGDDRAVLIVDDRADVWDYSSNLLPVHPYVCFPHATDMNALHAGGVPDAVSAQPDAPAEAPVGGAEDTEALAARTSDLPPEVHEDICAAADEPDTGQDLRTLADVLCHVHAEFFRAHDVDPTCMPDAKAIARRRVGSVLAGVRVAFTGVLPLHADPRRTDAWRMAEFFGAACDPEPVPGATTHIVAARNDTAKARRAFERGDAAVVRPEWLHACYRRYRCVDAAAVGALHAAPPALLASAVPADECAPGHACASVCSLDEDAAYPPPEDDLLQQLCASSTTSGDLEDMLGSGPEGSPPDVPLLSASQIDAMRAEIDALDTDSDEQSFTSQSTAPGALSGNAYEAAGSLSGGADETLHLHPKETDGASHLHPKETDEALHLYSRAVYDDAPGEPASIADEDFDDILASVDDASEASDHTHGGDAPQGRSRVRVARAGRDASRSPSSERPHKRGRRHS